MGFDRVPGHTNVLACALLISMAVCPARGADYYVAPTGSDASAGTSPAKAFRTIQAGVDAAQPGDNVFVLSGTYRETVTFRRSGTLGRPITVRPYHGARVTVTGCDPVTGWSRCPEKPGVWKAPMAWTLGIGRNQVFEAGKVLIEARHPNRPAPGLGMYVDGLSPLWPTYGEFSIPDPIKAPGRVVSALLAGHPADYWKGAIYYGVHYEGWCAQTGVVESSKGDEIEVGDRTNTWWFPYPGSGYSPEEGRGMLVGHMNALDAPGEWHWHDGTLYLIPPDGRAPENVEAKRRQLAFDLSACQHIRIRGIAVRAASMRLDGSAYCTVDACDLQYVSHFTLQYAMGEVAHGVDTIRSGETGIFVGGHDNAFLNCSIRFSAGAGFHLRGYHHTIHNCLIDEVDYTAHYLNAITDAVSDYGDYEGQLVGGHVITFNTMRNAGRHMFDFSGNGTSLASRTRGPMDYMSTLFAHNHLYNGMLLTKDAGMLTGYYCSGGTLDGLNSLVAFNVLHDTWDIFAMRINVLGIVYLDAGTCDVTLRDNLLWAAPGSLQRGLWYNTMCVGIQEHDNLFHPDFARTSTDLRPADFPRGNPFRFGHDFAHPPIAPEWPQLDRMPLRTPPAAHSLGDGSVIPLGVVDFDRGWRSAAMRYSGCPADANRDTSARAAPRHRKATDPLVLEATANDGASPGMGSQWTFVRNVRDRAWLKFGQVPLGEGYQRFRVVYGCVEDARRSVEIHLDAADGPLAGTVALGRTDRDRGGAIQIYAHAVGRLDASATGTRDVYLLFRNDDGKPVGEFEYFRFERYRGEVGLQKGELRVELRAGSPSGDRVGILYPLKPKGAGEPPLLVTSLEPVTGTMPLFAVVRSDLRGALGGFDAIRLEKARQPQDMAAIGIAPIRDAHGRMVLPRPTNRPVARPADKYGHTAAASSAPLVASRAAASGKYLPRAGLALWLDAGARSTIVLGEDGGVAKWLDRSGSARDAGQPEAAHRPAYSRNGLRGLPCIAFDERRQTRLEVPDLSTGKITATIFAVIANPRPPSEVNHDARVLTASDGKELDYVAGICASVPGMETGGPRQATWVAVDRWARNVHIGCFSPMYQTYFTGQIAEILVYGRALAAAEQRRVRTYLFSKWGVR